MCEISLNNVNAKNHQQNNNNTKSTRDAACSDHLRSEQVLLISTECSRQRFFLLLSINRTIVFDRFLHEETATPHNYKSIAKTLLHLSPQSPVVIAPPLLFAACIHPLRRWQCVFTLNAKEKPSEDPCRVPYKCKPVRAPHPLYYYYCCSAAKLKTPPPTIRDNK